MPLLTVIALARWYGVNAAIPMHGIYRYLQGACVVVNRHVCAVLSGAIYAKYSKVSFQGNAMVTHNSAEKDGGEHGLCKHWMHADVVSS